MKTIFQFLFLSLFIKNFFCQNKEGEIDKIHQNNFNSSPNIIIAVNKPQTKKISPINENNIYINRKKQNKLENIINNVEELLQNINDNKNKLVENANGRNYGLNMETEIINANDENVLNILLNGKYNLNKEKKNFSAPIIMVFPQPLTNQEIIDYEKYKELIKSLKKTKNLLLKVGYFEKLSDIKSKNKKEATKEIENTIKIIEKSISRRHIIDEILEEIYDEHRNEDKNIKKLKNESEFLKQKINVLNEKIRKLGYII
ncbi:conserved Plasmodium protein, unknown function [Plasmodium gallinaceum]|uniref:Uncharacterized protein n=1 Tax=Plasmodium gallinaceum TaxID=5849 RepID=A0A1J1H360_PLAGA|nr:conserved Plasmodium protein, unknown function [Plasmodium gallinaceum]CRG97774.1 conserved Plasmodium protein, unknown function [Plasmodium gallinaceum]